MRNIVVSGGAGFVGSSVAIRLLREGVATAVTAFDNLKRSGSELNLPRLQEAGVKFLHGDVRNRDDLARIGPMDLIIECSAEPSVLGGRDGNAAYVVDTNLLGAVNCLEVARRHDAAIIFLSTSRVYPYGAINDLSYKEESTRFVLSERQATPGVSSKGISEEFPLEGVRSLYGATKLAAEYLLAEYVSGYGIRGIVNRCGVLTGPWQMGRVDQGFVALWAARHVLGGELNYIGFGGKGKQVRDILHIDDYFELLRRQIEHMEVLSGKTFNVGGGDMANVSLCELTTLCRDLTGKSIIVNGVEAERPADLRWYITDNSRVSDATGWRPTLQAPAIVEDVCRWITDNAGQLRRVLGGM